MKTVRIIKNSKEYPKRLKDLYDPPKRLNVLGENFSDLLDMPTLGIVGSRKLTDYGRSVTEKLAAELAGSGICIISGLALGVDSVAHRTALDVGGKTVAVMPGGVKKIYPASHKELARDIITKGGSLISEHEDDFRPRKESFIQRNRIIAGLSDALLVTEAAERSGSLHTANFALDNGRTVLAVPGNISSPTSVGTNNLIKAGAVMVTEAQDVLDALNITPKRLEQMKLYGEDEHESLILNLLSSGITSSDDLRKNSRLDSKVLDQTLRALELRGAIYPLGNNHWRIR